MRGKLEFKIKLKSVDCGAELLCPVRDLAAYIDAPKTVRRVDNCLCAMVITEVFPSLDNALDCGCHLLWMPAIHCLLPSVPINAAGLHILGCSERCFVG